MDVGQRWDDFRLRLRQLGRDAGTRMSFLRRELGASLRRHGREAEDSLRRHRRDVASTASRAWRAAEVTAKGIGGRDDARQSAPVVQRDQGEGMRFAEVQHLRREFPEMGPSYALNALFGVDMPHVDANLDRYVEHLREERFFSEVSTADVHAAAQRARQRHAGSRSLEVIDRIERRLAAETEVVRSFAPPPPPPVPAAQDPTSSQYDPLAWMPDDRTARTRSQAWYFPGQDGSPSSPAVRREAAYVNLVRAALVLAQADTLTTDPMAVERGANESLLRAVEQGLPNPTREQRIVIGEGLEGKVPTAAQIDDLVDAAREQYDSYLAAFAAAEHGERAKSVEWLATADVGRIERALDNGQRVLQETIERSEAAVSNDLLI